MATDTLRDQLYLQDLMQNALSPISNYGQGLLQLAVAKRTREMQLEDEARRTSERRAEAETERAFTRERDTAQQAFTRERDVAQQNFQERQSAQNREFQLRLQEAAERAGIDRLAFQWDYADQKEKENILRNLKASASEVGAPIPDSKLSFDEQFNQLSTGISKAETQGVMNLMQGLSQDEAMLSKLTSSNPQERDKLAVEILLSDAEATKALTPAEKMKIMADPKAVIPIMNRLAGDKSKKGVEAFNTFVEAQQKSKATADEVFLKRAASRTDAELVRGRLAERRAILVDKFKGHRFPADVYTNMFSAVNDEVGKIQQEQAPKLPPLPPPVVQPGSVGGSEPSAAIPQTGWPGIRNLPAVAAQAVASRLPAMPDVSGITAYPKAVGNYIWSGGTPPPPPTLPPAIRQAPAYVGGLLKSADDAMISQGQAFWQRLMNKIAQGQPVTPEERNTALRLQTTIQDQTAAQNALAPTAFPALPPVFTGAP